MTERLELPASSAGAGAKLYWQAWLPEAPPRAGVVIAHGYAEHLGRYEHVAAHFTALGLAVFALDHWGHGQSDGVPGFVPRFSAFTDGMEQLLTAVEAAHPHLPLILLGHSMGGLIATLHLPTHQSHYAGAVLSGPLIIPSEAPSRLMQWISRLLSRIAPRLGVLALDATGVSRDPAVVAAYLADPLVYNGKVSARLAAEMFAAMAHARAAAPSIVLPMLLLHGGEDRLTSPDGSRYLAAHLGSADRTLTIYPGLYHEIFNEPEQGEVLGDVSAWIDAHLAGEKP
ncbi:MAG TPA: lysophospholipase [Novosphingobium sp.]|nr:lysophospholipase [Novosphingobium sp.]